LRHKLLWLCAAAALAPAAPALAQAPPPAKPAPSAPAKPAKPAAKKPDGAVGEVVVTGQGQEQVRVSADRRSYSVANDLQAATGSLSDALRNIPSVEVDVQGNLSLRGDPNVTILIDGKPSALFKGEGRADALQRLPANSIDRVEVITNPSAALNPEGSGGVINLITKKAKGVGGSGTVRAFGGTNRETASLNGGYNSKKLSLTGEAFIAHQKQKSTANDARERIDPVTGDRLASVQDSHFQGAGTFWNLHGGGDYDMTGTLRLSAEASHFAQHFDNTVLERYSSFDASGAPTADFFRDGGSGFRMRHSDGSASFRKTFSGEDHELTGDLDYQTQHGTNLRTFTTLTRLPPTPDLYEAYAADFTEEQTKLKLEYKRPLPGGAKLTAGYELQVDDNAYGNAGSRGPSPDTLVPVPALDNRFGFEQQVNSAYATYERQFDRLNVLGGLRLEQVNVDLTQLSQGVQAGNDYFRAYPSLHLGYKLTDSQQLTFSYSHRIQRPTPNDLNPFRIFIDAFNFRQGNPRLEPSETHSWELAYQYRANQTFYLATLYYRQRFNEVTDVVQDLGGGVFLTTRQNLGESRNGGLELVANSRFTKTLTFNVSSNLYWNEIEARALGFTQAQSGWTISGRANVNWTVTPKDFVQLNVGAQGKQLTPQGFREVSPIVNLGYRHKFNEKVSAIVQVQDLFDTFGQTIVLDTPTLHQRRELHANVRGIFAGLTYNFGGPSRRRQTDFDFGGGGGGPPAP
jgi:outer membrane receptor protein involved in Fe transport